MLDHDDAKALVRQGQEAGFLTHEEIATARKVIDEVRRAEAEAAASPAKPIDREKGAA